MNTCGSLLGKARRLSEQQQDNSALVDVRTSKQQPHIPLQSLTTKDSITLITSTISLPLTAFSILVTQYIYHSYKLVAYLHHFFKAPPLQLTSFQYSVRFLILQPCENPLPLTASSILVEQNIYPSYIPISQLHIFLKVPHYIFTFIIPFGLVSYPSLRHLTNPILSQLPVSQSGNTFILPINLDRTSIPSSKHPITVDFLYLRSVRFLSFSTQPCDIPLLPRPTTFHHPVIRFSEGDGGSRGEGGGNGDRFMYMSEEEAKPVEANGGHGGEERRVKKNIKKKQK